MEKQIEVTLQPLLLNMAQACETLSLGKSKVYELMETENLPYIRLGKSLRFPYFALQRWLEQRLQSDVA